MSNAELIDGFYAAFAAGDHETMARSYADEATFDDPVFEGLDAEHVRAMWRMFCTQSQDLAITWSDVAADDTRGSARWEARYTFSATGRPVHNVIEARFDFADGKIITHRDSFSFYRWARMALGPVGMLLGWTPLLRHKVGRKARAQLDRFMAGEASAEERSS